MPQEAHFKHLCGLSPDAARMNLGRRISPNMGRMSFKVPILSIHGLHGCQKTHFEHFRARVQCFGAGVGGSRARVRGFGARVQGFGSRVRGLGLRVRGLEARVRGFGSRARGFGRKVQGSEARVRGFGPDV